MSEVMQMSDARPWYRHGWVWFVIALPLSAVVAGLTTVWIAASDPDSLVVDDYYKEGLAINEVKDRQRKAARLGLRADLMLSGERVRVHLAAAQPLDLQAIELRFIHPTRERHDQRVTLRTIGGGMYEGRLAAPLATTRWYVHIVDPDETWRLQGRLDTARDSTLHIDAARMLSGG